MSNKAGHKNDVDGAQGVEQNQAEQTESSPEQGGAEGVPSSDEGQVGSGVADGEPGGMGANRDRSGYDELIWNKVVEPIDAVPPAPEGEDANLIMEFLAEDADYAKLPHPDVFNAYPIEVQRKIIEWTDRDVKARRDDESRRQDALASAKAERDRMREMLPTIIIVLSILCGAVAGIVTANPAFPLAFLLVPLAVIVARVVTDCNFRL